MDQEDRPGGGGLGHSRCKRGTIYFPLPLKEVGLQNHVNVGGWGEDSLGAESLDEQRKRASSEPFPALFLVLPTLPPVLRGERKPWAGPGDSGGPAGSPSTFVHLPTGSSPGIENYLCLQIALDSHELFPLPANRSGDGRELSSQRAEKSRGDGRRGTKVEVTSLGIWFQLCHCCAITSLPQGSGFLSAKEEGCVVCELCCPLGL